MKNWDNISEQELEEFIIKNKDKFEVVPRPQVVENFRLKLRRIIISIVPYIIKVAMVVLVVWSISILAWWIFGIPTLWDLIIGWFK